VRLARKYKLPIFVGEFGALFHQPAKQAKFRIKAIQDQIEVYEKEGASWAIWTYKDIGIRRGVLTISKDSLYFNLIRPVLAARESLADWTSDLETPVGHTIGRLMDSIDQTLTDLNVDIKIERSRFKQHLMFGYNAQLLQVAYVQLFLDKSEKEIADIFEGFKFKNCVPMDGVISLLQKYIKEGYDCI
jgi:hypothetical protein